LPGDDDEDEPGAEAVGVSCPRRCEHPQEVGRIELDGRELVGSEVLRSAARLRAQNRSSVDADDISGAVEPEIRRGVASG
jgi:hypothetical protein